MKQEKNKEEKRKTGMARCLAAVCSFIPYLSIYFVIRELILVFPDMPAADMPAILMCGWFALAGIAGNVVLYFCALMCSHLAAFGTLYELKLNFADYITAIPLGYHLTIGNYGREYRKYRKIYRPSIPGFCCISCGSAYFSHNSFGC